VGTAIALLAGCDDALNEPRPANILVRVPRTDRPLVLEVGAADAGELGLDDETVEGNFGSFVLRTSHTETEDIPFEHCLEGELVIVATDTGVEEHVVPAGTCLSSDDPLDLGSSVRPAPGPADENRGPGPPRRHGEEACTWPRHRTGSLRARSVTRSGCCRT
jgi:hypothetical protein